MSSIGRLVVFQWDGARLATLAKISKGSFRKSNWNNNSNEYTVQKNANGEKYGTATDPQGDTLEWCGEPFDGLSAGSGHARGRAGFRRRNGGSG